MSDRRDERAKDILRSGAAEFFAREAGPQSLITVTRVDLASDFSTAKIFLSVLPIEKAVGALGLANRNVKELKDYLRENTKLPRMPHIEFLLDTGENSELQ